MVLRLLQQAIQSSLNHFRFRPLTDGNRFATLLHISKHIQRYLKPKSMQYYKQWLHIYLDSNYIGRSISKLSYYELLLSVEIQTTKKKNSSFNIL